MQKFHTGRFEKIPEDKQERVLKAAISEFAHRGYNATNINTVAEKAGISIGSMYNYFKSKEDLFLAVIDFGYKELESILKSVENSEGDLFAKLEKLFRIAQEHAKDNREIIQIYHDMSTQGLKHISSRLSYKMEHISIVFYKQLLKAGQEEGLIDAETDISVAALCIDNIMLILQYSYSSEYFQERLKLFTDDDTSDDERIIRGIMRFLRNALRSIS